MAPSSLAMLESADQLQSVVCRALRCRPEDIQRVDSSTEVSGAVAYGFLSSCGGVTVEAEVSGRVHELHLFVKREEHNVQGVLDGLQSFQREAKFYNDLLPLLQAAWNRGQPQLDRPDLGPAAYLGTNSVVVMEDLTRRGYTATGDWVSDGLDYDVLQQSLRALARVHAASLVAQHCDGVDFPALAPFLLDETFFTRRPGTVGRQLFEVGSEAVRRVLLPQLLKSESCGLSDAVPRSDAELRRLQHLALDMYLTLDMDAIRRGERVLVLTHGDAWPNNVLLHRDPQGRVEHAALVDFQMVRWGPPAFDVVMFLYVSMRRSPRQQHMDSLLRGYYQDLATFTRQRGLDISSILSLQDFLESADRMSTPCRTLASTYMPTLACKGRDQVDFFEDADSRFKIMMETDARLAALEKWFHSQDDEYRRHVRERVEDLLELPHARESA